MKQGKHYMTVVLWILLAAIAAYFGYHFYSSIREPLTTAKVIEYEAGSSYYASGYVVRDENPVLSEYDVTTVTAKEGAHISAGEPIATGYLSADAQSRQSRIELLKAQLEQLDYARRYSGSIADQASLDSQIAASLSSFVRFVARRDINSTNALSPELKGQILRRAAPDGDSSMLQAQITAVQNELDMLQGAAQEDTKAVTAPMAGYFSANIDGYESVLTPDRMTSINYRDYLALTPKETGGGAGKLIAGDTWYYLTLVPADQLKDVEKGDRAKLRFARDYYGDLDMRVERVGPNEAGFRILVLSCDRYMQDITLLRQQSADIVFGAVDGLRVPKDAVRIGEGGQTGVYVLEGATAKWKPITILHDNGESYLVQLDRTSTANLWPGDEVIIAAKNLYDGKVVVVSQ